MATALTQGSLKLLDTCPRRFQYQYLEHCLVPSRPIAQEGQRWGSRFHEVMQQRQLGLPVDALVASDPELAAAVAALDAAAPDLLRPPGATFCQSEHRRSTAVAGYGLTAIYDLLVLYPHRGEIVDWKTHLRPPTAAQLAQDWQTRLYLYVLVETTDLSPAQVSMTYWFVRHRPDPDGPPVPQATTLAYSTAQHRRTAQDINRLAATFDTYQQQWPQAPLPQVPLDLGRCESCPFAQRCQRGEAAVAVLPTVADIAEVPL